LELKEKRRGAVQRVLLAALDRLAGVGRAPQAKAQCAAALDDAVPPWNENDVVIENGAVEPFAFAVVPAVVELALVALNTGPRASAWALPLEVLCEDAAEADVPAPNCTAEPPDAATLVAAAVVAVAARAGAAINSAAAAMVANRVFFIGRSFA
jgi:hypothetical protein